MLVANAIVIATQAIGVGLILLAIIASIVPFILGFFAPRIPPGDPNEEAQQGNIEGAIGIGDASVTLIDFGIVLCKIIIGRCGGYEPVKPQLKAFLWSDFFGLMLSTLGLLLLVVGSVSATAGEADWIMWLGHVARIRPCHRRVCPHAESRSA